MSFHLFVYPESAPPVGTDFITTTVLDSLPDAAREQIAAGAAQCAPDDVLVFWDTRLAPVPTELLDSFVRSGHDLWHASLRLPQGDAPDLLEYALPGDVYIGGIPAHIDGAVNYRLSLRAAFIRARVVRTLGGLLPGFSTLDGAALEMGWRWHTRGAILRQSAHMLPPDTPAVIPPIADRYLMLSLHIGRAMRHLVAVRRILGGAPLREWALMRRGDRGVSLPRYQPGALDRDLAQAALPAAPTVSVILPTYGRYKYIAEVLEDIRAQTIRPVQILVADGNPEAERDPSVYARFADLPLEVLFIPSNEQGICASRNACLARVTGEYVWFVDDDSRFDADNLENHLRLLAAYDAHVSVGPAYTRDRPELHSYQREVRNTFMDCGTTLCRTAILEQAGGFDMQFNRWAQNEDGDIGARMVIAGGVMLNNPHARRFHYLAPIGGTRTSANNIHRWRRWTLRPRPSPSLYYYTGRYFDHRRALRAAQTAWMLNGWRRKDGQAATRRWLISTGLSELLALPVSLIRLMRSVRIAQRMLAEGARIPHIQRQPATPDGVSGD